MTSLSPEGLQSTRLMACSQQWECYVKYMGYMDTECLGYCTNCLQKLLLAQLHVCQHYHLSLEDVYLLLSVILGIS